MKVDKQTNLKIPKITETPIAKKLCKETTKKDSVYFNGHKKLDRELHLASCFARENSVQLR